MPHLDYETPSPRPSRLHRLAPYLAPAGAALTAIALPAAAIPAIIHHYYGLGLRPTTPRPLLGAAIILSLVTGLPATLAAGLAWARNPRGLLEAASIAGVLLFWIALSTLGVVTVR